MSKKASIVDYLVAMGCVSYEPQTGDARAELIKMLIVLAEEVGGTMPEAMGALVNRIERLAVADYKESQLDLRSVKCGAVFLKVENDIWTYKSAYTGGGIYYGATPLEAMSMQYKNRDELIRAHEPSAKSDD